MESSRKIFVAEKGLQWLREQPTGASTIVFLRNYRSKHDKEELVELYDDSKEASGYADCFYQIANMLGINAQPKSPREVWEIEILPNLKDLVACLEWSVAEINGLTSYKDSAQRNNCLNKAQDILKKIKVSDDG